MDDYIAERLTRSTAARMDVQPNAKGIPRGIASGSSAGTHDVPEHLGSNPSAGGKAGTQAPPVDPPKRGRPRTGFDKKAYDAERMRKRRAKLKDGK